MKKIYLGVWLLCAGAGAVHAQLSEGGIPLSMNVIKAQDQQVAQQQYPAPDYNAIIKQNELDQANGVLKPYAVATIVSADISLDNAGTWTYLEDGSKIWRLSVSIPGAKAIDFFYDHFQLPEGVRLFLSNARGNQTLGAYTAHNNTDLGLFTNEPVQGDVVNIEMDIDPNVPQSSIQFHIDKMGAYYRGVSYLNKYIAMDDHATPARPTIDESATCHINAECPIADAPSDFTVPKDATVRVFIYDAAGNQIGFCSGTLINNTGNTADGVCKALLLTASHCDEENNRDDASFAQWKFQFNYQYDSCDGTHLHGTNPFLTGATFKARSNLPSFAASSPQDHALHLVGDFLLLQLTSSIPESYGAYLAGWNRDPFIALNPPLDAFYIGFHHPRGDVKKKSWGDYIQADGTFNQNQVASTHWYIPFDFGGTQEGSSGSGLFDKNGYLLGDLSGGTSTGCNNNPAYSDFGKEGLYSKISYDWDNNFDQTAFPAHAGAQSRLKDWLDPINSGVESLGPTKADCSDMPNIGINELKEMLGKSIKIYPNPSNTGVIHARVNFTNATDLKVSVYNALGVLQKEFTVSKAYSGDYSFDCNSLANGIYMMQFSTGNASVGKKVILAR